MHDGYLVNSLLNNHPSLKEEYARTSGYVHLSRRHFLSSNRLVEEQTDLIEGLISTKDRSISDRIILTKTIFVIKTTYRICRLVNSYTHMKNNP